MRAGVNNQVKSVANRRIYIPCLNPGGYAD